MTRTSREFDLLLAIYDEDDLITANDYADDVEISCNAASAYVCRLRSKRLIERYRWPGDTLRITPEGYALVHEMMGLTTQLEPEVIWEESEDEEVSDAA